MTDKECFIIMPITTPADYIPVYNDSEHFLHVMKCLLEPAIEKAGFIPIPPVTQGSEIIQGEIISNIENSDLVLCDMSILNPNVFFELGIRTALNKPVCLVKDNVTEKIPFDTSIINYCTYSPDLSSWITKAEIEKLSEHIIKSFSKSNNCNSLWKYFSLKSIATPPEKLNGDTEKIEYLMMQVDAIRRQLIPEKTITEKYNSEGCNFETKTIQPKDKNHIVEDIMNLLAEYNIDKDHVKISISSGADKIIHIIFDRRTKITVPDVFYKKLYNISKNYKVNIDAY